MFIILHIVFFCYNQHMISFNDYMKAKYGHKVYKLSFDIGCSCPNRDGNISTGGCIFCSEGGSGDFAEKIRSTDDIEPAIAKAKQRVASKVTNDCLYMAYFQSFTNTYGDINYLKSIYSNIIKRNDIVALSIGTRPDCINDDILLMLCELNAIKPVFIELGLQTIHDATASYINRGYKLDTFNTTYQRLKAAGIAVVIHIILGLPNETTEMMYETVKYICSLLPKPDGIKLALLHILKNTKLGEMYTNGACQIHQFTLDEYCMFIKKLLDIIGDDIVVHRLTGDAPKSLLIEPQWTSNKKMVINTLNKYLNT